MATVTLRGVRKSFGGMEIIHGVDLDIDDNELTVFVGPSGCGKSTLLRLIARLEPLQRGRVEIDGLDLASTPTERLALAMAVMGQQTQIASRLRVAELVGFGRWPHHQGRPRPADREAVENALEAFGLGPLRHRFLDEISGGQAQRAHLAMTFAQGPNWLLLDEPLNNLDMQHSVQMMQQLRRAADELGRTVVIVLHDINFAAHYADRIVAMGDGQVVETGTPAEILRPEVLERIFKTPCSVVDGPHGPLAVYY